MPFGGGLSLAGSAIGIGSSLAGLFGGGGANSINVPQPYQYQNMGGADTNAYQGIGNLAQYNTYGQLLPQAQGIGQGLVNNPYAGGYQSGAGQAGGMYQGAGQNAYAQGGALGQSATGALGGVNSLLQMGFDPQQALYNQLQGQNSQQYNAQNAASGIAGTPYGASVADQANNNFNLQWQNAQLGRAAEGAGAAGGLLGQIGGAQQQGAGLQAGGAASYLQGAQTPYSAFQGIGGQQLSNLGQIGQFGQSAAALPQQQNAEYLQYLQQGTQASQAANQAAALQLQQQNQGFNQSQALATGLGKSVAGFGQAWNNSNPTAGYFGNQNMGYGNTGNIGYGTGVGQYGPIPQGY